MISQLIKLAVIGISAVFLIAAAVVFWKKTRNQTKSQTKAELKKLKIFRMSALLFAIIMCFSSTLASYFDTTRQSSAVIALNYAEASLGQNVNGTRYNMSEIICDDVIERVIKKGGFTDLSVSDLKSCFSVVPLNQGNSYSKENYHISTEFAVYYNASKKTKKYDTNAIAQLLCNSYRDYYIAFAGRLSPEKGTRILKDAASLLPDTQFVVMGGGPDEKMLSDIPNIHLTGFVTGKTLDENIAGAKAVAVPSVCFENCPMAILEGQQLAVPSVTMNMGGMAELVEDGKTGVLSKAVTAESFAAAIKDILSDEKRLEKMKENCLENAKTFLDIDSYCKKLLEIYSEVINNG